MRNRIIAAVLAAIIAATMLCSLAGCSYDKMSSSYESDTFEIDK